MTDIAQIKPVSRTIEIKNPGNSMPLGIRLNIVSMDDKRLVKVKRAISDHRMQLERKGKSGFNAEQIEENVRNLQFAATTGWEWYNPTGKEGDEGYDADATPSFEGETNIEFNQRNFMRIVTALPWFGEQISEELGEREAFFAQSNSN